VLTGEGPLRLDIPRDRDGSFNPVLIPKHERRFTGFDDKITAMYARGMTMREIQGFLQESYGVDVSPEFISSVTEAVMAEVTAWQSRPLEPMYPVVFFDALRVKIKEDAVVRNKAIYLALGVLPDGSRDILGLWIEGTEGAKFWMKVFNDLKTRGVNDILIAVTDGLKGMPEAWRGVPGHHLADVHRGRTAPDSQQPGLRWSLEGPQAACRGDSPDLHGCHR
jgi:putative transposase